ncbi:MAG: porin [Thiohalospira sp.]
MQKHVIATGCLLAFAAVPATAANIEFNGVANAEVASVSGDGYGGNEGLMVTDAMRRDGKYGGNETWMGIKGSYALDDDYTAIARARLKVRPGNWGFNKASKYLSDTGDPQGASPETSGANNDSLFSGRDAFAGIKGPFGSVTIGTMSSPYKSTTVKWDPLKGTFLQARGQGGMSRAQNSYLPNTIAYGNKFGGAKVKLSMTMDESEDPDNAGEANGEHGYSFGATLPLGDATDLAIGYQDLGDKMDFADEGSSSAKVAVRHQSGGLTLVGQYETTENYATNYDNAADFVYGSATWAFDDKNELILSLGANEDTNDGDKDSGDTSGTYAALGMKHHFSKKARVHGGLIHSASDDLDDYTGIGAGFRVNF